MMYKLISDVIAWPIISRNADCPSASNIINTIAKLDLSIDWCLTERVFPSFNDDHIAIYTDNPIATFPLRLIDSLESGKLKKPYLLTPAMAASIIDDVTQERAVSQLFGESKADVAALAEEAPVINLVNNILERAIEADASDIHIESGIGSMIVRFRVDGRLNEYMQQPSSRFPAIASRIKLLSHLDIAEKRLPQDGRFSTRSGKSEYDIRVSTAPDVHGESIVMRLLPKQRDELSLESLGFEDDHLDLIRSWSSLSNGIVLVTGPTGSGKSTTLYGLLDEMRTGEEKILTVEDPVEYQLEGITQVQAREDIGYTFARALRTFLRQDPDIIMVGEIRDKETADIAVQSSLTGHLVLSTIHTNDACSVFPRLTDIGVEPYMVAATIQGVEAQRLVRKLCQKCAKRGERPAFLKKNTPRGKWCEPVGCDGCQGKGYQGRIGIYEMVAVTPRLRSLITREAPLAELRDQARKDGSRSLMDDGLLKASKGITSVNEVLRVCSDKEFGL
ncbi:MAG: type II secretion system protein [Crocinitomicaceae bacterium]|nr:type II secretion system protein [Crocinitomicaceae bacterium]